MFPISADFDLLFAMHPCPCLYFAVLIVRLSVSNVSINSEVVNDKGPFLDKTALPTFNSTLAL
jgi:predicted ATPase with chaperone activity